jgi:hypothetical protein
MMKDGWLMAARPFFFLDRMWGMTCEGVEGIMVDTGQSPVQHGPEVVEERREKAETE